MRRYELRRPRLHFIHINNLEYIDTSRKIRMAISPSQGYDCLAIRLLSSALEEWAVGGSPDCVWAQLVLYG